MKLDYVLIYTTSQSLRTGHVKIVPETYLRLASLRPAGDTFVKTSRPIPPIPNTCSLYLRSHRHLRQPAHRRPDIFIRISIVLQFAVQIGPVGGHIEVAMPGQVEQDDTLLAF